jgi:glutamate-1-semialdehyde 2,1-aminomutase
MIQSPTSETLTNKARKVIPGGINSGTRGLPTPVVFGRSEGAYIYDVDGQRYLDYHAAFGPIVLGHNHPNVTEKVIEAVRQIDLIGAGVTELEIALAEKIVQHVPAAEQVLLCNTGSEANYHAIRLARAVTGRRRLIKFQGCYHGIHDELLMNIITPAEKVGSIDPGSAGMLPETVAQTIVLPFNDVVAFERTMAQFADEIAAVILEPIPHNVGCILPTDAFLQSLRERTRATGSLLIFDEVVTGFRHALGGCQALMQITPDLTTMAKAIANGYPCALLAGRADLLERFSTAGGDVFFAGTYNGHPNGVAAALATINELEDGSIHAHTDRLAWRFKQGLEELAVELDIEMTVACYGSVCVPYFMSGPITSYNDLLRNNTARDVAFRRKMTDHGIFMTPLAIKRNHISAAHTEADIDHTLTIAAEVLREVREQGSL